MHLEPFIHTTNRPLWTTVLVAQVTPKDDGVANIPGLGDVLIRNGHAFWQNELVGVAQSEPGWDTVEVRFTYGTSLRPRDAVHLAKFLGVPFPVVERRWGIRCENDEDQAVLASAWRTPDGLRWIPYVTTGFPGEDENLWDPDQLGWFTSPGLANDAGAAEARRIDGKHVGLCWDPPRYWPRVDGVDLRDDEFLNPVAAFVAGVTTCGDEVLVACSGAIPHAAECTADVLRFAIVPA